MKDEDTLRLAIDTEDRKIYKELKESGPLVGIDNSPMFMLAMVIGYRKGIRLPLKSRDQFIQGTYLHKEQKSIIKAIAIFEEKDVKILFDPKKVYSIAEEYAHGGIRVLKELSNSRLDFSKKLVSELSDAIKENEKEILEFSEIKIRDDINGNK